MELTLDQINERIAQVQRKLTQYESVRDRVKPHKRSNYEKGIQGYQAKLQSLELERGYRTAMANDYSPFDVS